MQITLKTAGNPADALGRLKAVQAELAAEEKRLKERLVEMAGGRGFVEGASFRVTVTRVAPGRVFDAAVAKRLFLTPAQAAACMKETAPSLRVVAKARVADGVVREAV